VVVVVMCVYVEYIMNTGCQSQHNIKVADILPFMCIENSMTSQLA